MDCVGKGAEGLVRCCGGGEVCFVWGGFCGAVGVMLMGFLESEGDYGGEWRVY